MINGGTGLKANRGDCMTVGYGVNKVAREVAGFPATASRAIDTVLKNDQPVEEPSQDCGCDGFVSDNGGVGDEYEVREYEFFW